MVISQSLPRRYHRNRYARQKRTKSVSYKVNPTSYFKLLTQSEIFCVLSVLLSDFTVAGTAVQYLAQQPVTVAIMKDGNMHTNKDHYRFGVLFDGSDCSKKVLRKTLSMVGDNSRLTCITVVEPGVNPDTIEE